MSKAGGTGCLKCRRFLLREGSYGSAIQKPVPPRLLFGERRQQAALAFANNPGMN